MESIGYKKIFSQKIAHKEFVERIEDWDLDHLDENSDAMIDEILEFLATWLIDHILYSDKQIGQAE